MQRAIERRLHRWDSKRKSSCSLNDISSFNCRGLQWEGAEWGAGHCFISFEHMHRIQNQWKRNGQSVSGEFSCLANSFQSNPYSSISLLFLQALASMPRYLLTPFLISALLTMCNINRYLDSTRLASSTALPFLRTVIRNNERERELCRTSAWCRHTSEQNVVEMEKILTILIEQR